MAHTETRPGFRLPWTGERTESEPPVEEASAVPAATDDPTPAEELVTPDMIDANATASARRPTKFMADLSRAMQTAAENSRDETLARFTAEAKTVVEEIGAGSTVESAALRRRADDDIAAVREWSKAAVARIRDETEARIATRKIALDGEIEAHAAVVEARVQGVAARVADFESQMAAFFQGLLAEEDPTRIATMAETMPEPPDLAGVAASIAEPTVQPFDPVTAGMAASFAVEPDGSETTEASSATGSAAPAGLDFAAAEAEAAAFSGDLDDDEGLTSPAAEREAEPSNDPDQTATLDERSASGERVTTRVVVLGLVSVASIATFKRSLGRVPGVSAIGVASGPDGEFVFTVSHDSGFGLADAIGGLPGFDAHVTAESADGLEVAAHDPDAGA